MTSIDPAAAKRAAQAMPSIPCDAEGPVFREPWEAQAFAMALALRLMDQCPYLRRIPARLLGVGFRPEHIQTPERRF